MKHRGLNRHQADDFITQSLETFRWHHQATVSAETYQQLHEQHRLIADVVAFKGPHINHLTPRTLNIDAVQTAMAEHNITPKAVIEGPPPPLPNTVTPNQLQGAGGKNRVCIK